MILEIKKFPEKVLRGKTNKIEDINDEIRELANDMLETMYDAPGIGLAAPQVGILKKIVVIDVTAGDDKSQQLVLINPEIIASSGEEEGEEGCLSVPEEYELVTRAAEVTAKALDLDGNEIMIEADGLLARAIQHELDHLEGKLFIDRLSSLKKDMLKKRIKKRITAGSY